MHTAIVILFRMGCLCFDSKRFCLAAFTVLCYYFCRGEMNLKTKLQSNTSNGVLPFRPSNETYPCTSAVTCSLNVRLLFSDFPNTYILLPLATDIFESWKSILSQLNPVIMSFLHLCMSLGAAKLVADEESIITRRLGALLYQFQNLMHVTEEIMARSRVYLGMSNEKGERIRYYFDGGNCLFGCLFLVIGCYSYLSRRRFPARLPRRQIFDPFGIHNPPVARVRDIDDFQSSSSESEEDLNDPEFPVKRSEGYPIRTTFFFLVNALLCCIGWNHYVEKFSSVLESSTVSPTIRALQGTAVQSTSFWIIAWFWKLINHQSVFQLLLIAIFVDKMGEFMTWVNSCCYLGLIITCLLSERYYESIQELLAYK